MWRKLGLLLEIRYVWCSYHLALLVLFDSVYFVMFSAIWALPSCIFHLVIVAAVANLVLAVAWIKLLFEVFQLVPAYIANVVSSDARVAALGQRWLGILLLLGSCGELIVILIVLI
jgi:hypothetical protein